jgi:hypothetical protein
MTPGMEIAGTSRLFVKLVVTKKESPQGVKRLLSKNTPEGTSVFRS